VLNATHKSDIVESSVSPDLCEITEVKLFSAARFIAEIVYVNDPT